MLQSKNNSIQGLRFWAITLIIASHIGLLSQGGVGNNIFFAMSGFFVCQPYKSSDYEYEYFNIKRFLGYYKNRIIRIIPVCWLCMFFATWGLRVLDFRDFSTENSLLLNMFFIKSKMHLWFLQQEIFFYLCAPFLILIIAIVKKCISKLIDNKLWINVILFILLNIAALLSYKYSMTFGAFLYGNGSKQLFRIWLFLIGMSFSYLLKSCREISLSSRLSAVLAKLGGLYVAVCLLASIISAEEIMSAFNSNFKGYHIGWEQPLAVAYIAGFSLVVLSLLSDDNIIKSFLGNRLFLFIGNISFSMYLIHGFLLSDFAYLTAYRAFMVIYLISLCMAVVIYNYIEQPIIKKFLY